jgi:hypothetical protein
VRNAEATDWLRSVWGKADGAMLFVYIQGGADTKRRFSKNR